MKINGKEYATAKELAALVGVTRQSIYRVGDKIGAIWHETPSGFRHALFDVNLAMEFFLGAPGSFKHARIKANLLQRNVSEQTGIPAYFVHRFEKGSNLRSKEIKNKLTSFYNSLDK